MERRHPLPAVGAVWHGLVITRPRWKTLRAYHLRHDMNLPITHAVVHQWSRAELDLYWEWRNTFMVPRKEM